MMRQGKSYTGRFKRKYCLLDPDTGEINRQRTRDSDSESDLSLDHASLDLASSHSSDEDHDYNRDTWKKKATKKPPEVPPKPNITAESNLYGTSLVPSKGFNLSPSSNVASYTPLRQFGEKGAPQRLQDVSSYLDPNFTPELLDEVSSPEQLPVPERGDSLQSSVNNINNDLNLASEDNKQTNTNVSSALEGKKVVLPQLTTAEVSSESEESNETSV
ncbi:uncharacterized protein CEXT_474931 [Caerostris extrusa]|uniref:Uncharacterized protein n=1 Tax=Caerostris extrusa TaxID=172846 RepID=A0AAV4N288_CAEEX|nr:uncharacterized protein CEXT_474931 [Caerostris extrusa]